MSSTLPKLSRYLGFALVLLLCSRFGAANPAQTPHLQVKLIPESQSVEPGKDFSVAFDFKLKPGWHIYWLNPGDSGEPIKVRWDKPFAGAGDLQFPLPQKIPVGPLVNFGYEGEAILLAKVHAPSDLPAGGEASLTAHLSWLVCQEDCIPEKAELSVRMPVQSGAAKSDPSAAELFARARAALPAGAPKITARLETAPGSLTLKFATAPWQSAPASGQVYFFPKKPGLIEPAAAQSLAQDGDQWKLTMQRGALGNVAVERLEGVLGFRDAAGKPAGVWLEASPQAAAGAFPWQALGFAFLGGLLLNLMPCVFPVLSIKILHWAKKAGNESGVALRHALVYGLGILVSFWILAGLLLALRAGGSQLGWGFHLQSPRFIAFLALLFFFLGLSFLGVFEIGASWLGLGQNLTKSSGYRGSFFTGVLATVVATPCLAPFMAPAIGVALTQKYWVALAIFTGLALGMALPFVALTAFPRLLKRLPKPGRWMESLQQILGFFLFATMLWLLWVLGAQAGINGVIATLGGMLLLAFGLWIAHRAAHSGAERYLAKSFALLACAAALTLTYANVKPEPAGTNADAIEAGLIPWKKYTPENLEELRKQGKPVFLNFTAAWCITCKVNEKLVLNRPDIVRLFSEKQVAALKGDWTNQDATIAATLASFGREGVPLYVLYKPGASGEPKVLPQILTQGEIIQELENL